MLQNRRQFTTEFKIEAVRLIEGSGRTSVDVARSLGIDGGLLRRWRQIYGRDGNVIDLKTAEAEIISKEEVRRLRREVEQLRQERDILKKAAAIFSREPR